MFKFRVLEFNQAFDIYPASINKEEFINRIDTLAKSLIRYDKVSDNVYYLYLTEEGYTHLKNNNITSSKMIKRSYTKVKNLDDSAYVPYSNLKMDYKLINHQLHLNQFIINFENAILKYKENNPEYKFKYEYRDEKDDTITSIIRPDAYVLFNNNLIFLEMDMNTESKEQLMEKWKRYYEYFSSTPFQNLIKKQQLKVSIAFIIDVQENDKQKKQFAENARIKQVQDSFFKYFKEKNMLEFELYIKNSHDMLQVFNNAFINGKDNLIREQLSLKSIEGLEDIIKNNVINQTLNDLHLFDIKTHKRLGKIFFDISLNYAYSTFLKSHYLHSEFKGTNVKHLIVVKQQYLKRTMAAYLDESYQLLSQVIFMSLENLLAVIKKEKKLYECLYAINIKGEPVGFDINYIQKK